MPTKKPHNKTAQINGIHYIVHEHNTWRVCIKADGNEHAYTPTFRTGWEGQQPRYKYAGLVPSPKTETIGRLTAAHQARIYRDWQEKRGASPVCSPTH